MESVGSDARSSPSPHKTREKPWVESACVEDRLPAVEKQPPLLDVEDESLSNSNEPEAWINERLDWTMPK